MATSFHPGEPLSDEVAVSKEDRNLEPFDEPPVGHLIISASRSSSDSNTRQALTLRYDHRSHFPKLERSQLSMVLHPSLFPGKKARRKPSDVGNTDAPGRSRHVQRLGFPVLRVVLLVALVVGLLIVVYSAIRIVLE